MDKSELGDRMKLYEDSEAARRLMPLLPAMARLDGRSFSRFTRNTKKPFSRPFLELMDEVTRFLVEETAANVGYTQSDEISLVWYSSVEKSQIFFGGRIQKMCSSLAAMASAKLNSLRDTRPEFGAFSGLNWRQLPTFDCRVWNVPNLTEASNTLVWRQLDAARNSVSMLARSRFSHKQCHNKTTAELQEMLHSRFDENWNDLPFRQKRGVFVRKVKTERRFTAEELESLPPKHHARSNPDLVVERTDYRMTDLWLTKIPNRVEVLFSGADPEPMVPVRKSSTNHP